MCFICNKVREIDKFPNADAYLECLSYVQRLVNSKDFRFHRLSCPTYKVYDERGFWVDDLLTHIIRCTHCGQKFICECDTYNGVGKFARME